MAITRQAMFEDFCRKAGHAPTGIRLEQMFLKLSGADQAAILAEMKGELVTLYQTDVANNLAAKNASSNTFDALINAINVKIIDIQAL